MSAPRARRWRIYLRLASGLVLTAVMWCAGPAHGQPIIVPVILSTVADLPGTSTVPRLVSDGASSSDCITGGGSTFVWCYYTGSAWVAFGDGGGGGGSQNLFETIDAPAGTDPVADSATDTLTLAATAPVTITGDASTDTLTFALTQGAGTDVTADLEEETHASEHSFGGADPVTITEAQVSDLQPYLLNVVEDSTPQLGGELDASGNSVIGLGDVTFRTGAGGTLRTGTSAADLFKLQAYDTNGATYRDMLELDAGVVPIMSLYHVTELDIDDGGAIRTGSLAGETALIQARDVDGASWTTFATLTANNTPTFDLAASTTVGGAAIQTGTDDDVPEAGDFGALALAGPITSSGLTTTVASLPLESATLTNILDDEVLLGSGAGTGAFVALPDCDDGSGHLNYDTTTNAWSCGTTDDDVPEAGDFGALALTGNVTSSGLTTTIASWSGVTIADGGSYSTVSSYGTSLFHLYPPGQQLIRSVSALGGALHSLNTSATQPFVQPLRGDTDSGLGAAGNGDVRLIADAVSGLGQTATVTTLYVAHVTASSAATCADSGDANPGTLAINPAGTSNVHVTNSDADGCNLSISETGAAADQVIEIELVSTAGGTITMTDTAGAQNLAGNWTPGVGDSLTARYNLTASEWRERARADI